MVVTPKGRRTEAAFHQAARQVFAEKGFLNAKISDIALAAGRSPGSFYNYYDNKQQLLEALLLNFNSDVLERARLRATDDQQQNIEEAVRVYFETFREYVPEMIGAYQLSMTDAKFADWWRTRRDRGIKGVLTVVRAVERTGIEVDLEHTVFASAIVSMLDSFCWQWFAAGGDSMVETRDDEVAIRVLTEIWRRSIYNGRQPAHTADKISPGAETSQPGT
jgi:AcrR family transcriptional regulator